MSRKEMFLNQLYLLLRSYTNTNDLLQSSIILNFKKLQTDVERVNFAFTFFVNDGDLINEACFPIKIEKCNETSLRLREQGNEMYRIRKALKALYLYTESIAYATDDSPNLGMAYANRSAVLFVKGYFKECLEDIDRAFQYNYPSTLRDKLEDRRQRAISSVQSVNLKSVYYYNPTPVIENKHPKISAAADCVELKVNDCYGTHVVATRAIMAGEIISVEKPYVFTTCIRNKFLHCHNCTELCFNMIPCDKCSTTLYCSENCKSEASSSYHRYECDFGCFEQEKVISLKTILLCVLQNGLKDLGKNKANEEMYRSDRYLEIHRLETKEKEMDSFEYFVYSATAAIIYHCLKTRTNFLEENEVEENVLKEMLLHNILIEHSNTTLIEKVAVGRNRSEGQVVGEAIYSFSSRYNHSCVSNCFRTYHGTISVTRAINDIEMGEQCTVQYGWCYIKSKRSDRHDYLKKYLYFTCRCIACENNWPTYPDVFSKLTFSGCVKESFVREGYSGDLLTLQVVSLLDKVSVLQTQRIVSADEINEVLAQCFHLQKMVVQPSRALACIHNLIFHILLLPGNVVSVSRT